MSNTVSSDHSNSEGVLFLFFLFYVLARMFVYVGKQNMLCALVFLYF